MSLKIHRTVENPHHLKDVHFYSKQNNVLALRG